MSPQFPIPPVEDALDHLIDAIRSAPKAVAAYGYDVFIPNVVREFAMTQMQPHAPGSMRFEVDAVTEKLSRSFLDAAVPLRRITPRCIRNGSPEHSNGGRLLDHSVWS